MPATASTLTRMSRPTMVAVLAVGLLFAGTVALWAYYGTTVFFEVVRAGWAACF
jgi:hypothetical protein